MRFTIPFVFLLSLPFSPLQACNIDIYANKQMEPKVFFSEGEPKGILVDMLDYVSKDMGCQFHYKFSTWARAYKNMLDGNGAVIGLSKTANREKIIDYSDVMYIEEVLLVTHIDSIFEYKSINDLAGKVVLTSRGAHFDDEFEYAVENKLFISVKDNGNVAKRLERIAKGRADVAIISPGKFSFNNAIMNSSKLAALRDKLYILPTAFKKDPNYLGFSKTYDHQLFLKKFNTSLQKGKKSGAFKAIENKYKNE